LAVVLEDKWPVLGRHELAAGWLRIWVDLGRAPRTPDACARGLAEYLQVCEREGVEPVAALAISGRDGRAGDTKRLIACLELLWKGQSARHGSGSPTRPETLEEATMAVHLAIMPV
jgi:hypothetical protein